MKDIKKIIKKDKILQLLDILAEKEYIPIYADSLKDAKDILLNLVPTNSSIALGGSVTLNDLDIIDIFRNGNYQLFDRYNQPDWPSTLNCMRDGLLADYFITSTNAITMDGELIQTDSGGNRVASLLYGPKNVIVICGANKIVKDYKAGLHRVKNFCAPLNSKRINHKTPCNITGTCEDCNTKQRICNFTSIVRSGKRKEGFITIVIVNEEVGY